MREGAEEGGERPVCHLRQLPVVDRGTVGESSQCYSLLFQRLRLCHGFVSTSHSVEHLRDSRVQAPAFQLQKCRAGVRASVQQSGSVEEHTFLLKLLLRKAGKVSDSNCWVSESPVDVKG